MIGSVPDTTDPWLSAGRVLSRNQSNPGRKGSAGCEVSAIVNCGDEGGCDNRSYPRQRSQTFATIVSPADINQHVIRSGYSGIQVAILLDELPEQVLRQVRMFGNFDHLVALQPAPGRTCRHDT